MPKSLRFNLATFRVAALMGFIAFLSSFLSGCIGIYIFKPALVSVRDAETGDPVPNAKVSVIHGNFLMLNNPPFQSLTTNARGEGRLDVASLRAMWIVSAEGYFDDSLINPRDTKNVEFNLYRKPEAEVTIIVPDGYSGLLRIERCPVKSLTKEQAGRRYFTYIASSDGYVRIDISPLLLSDMRCEFHARYQDGTPIVNPFPGATKDHFILRRFTAASAHGNQRDLYVIGTADDLNAASALLYHHLDGPGDFSARLQRRINAMFPP